MYIHLPNIPPAEPEELSKIPIQKDAPDFGYGLGNTPARVNALTSLCWTCKMKGERYHELCSEWSKGFASFPRRGTGDRFCCESPCIPSFGVGSGKTTTPFQEGLCVEFLFRTDYDRAQTSIGPCSAWTYLAFHLHLKFQMGNEHSQANTQSFYTRW